MLKKLELLKSNGKLEFIKEQLSLVYTKPNGRRYSSSLLAMSAMWQDISPAAYNQILNDDVVTLPSTRHLRRITSALNADLNLSESSIQYLKVRKEKLSEKDLHVSLLLDEVHCKAKVQYMNGKFYGLENGTLTKSLLCTMIKSVAGSYRDTVSMSPISNINCDKIYNIWGNLVKVLSDIGFNAVITMSDQPSNVSFFQKVIGKSLDVQ